MSKEVSYNPLNPFQIAPGLDYVKVGRLFSRIESADMLAGGTQSVRTFINEYDGKGNASRISVSRSGSSDYVLKYTYDCR